MKVYRVWRETNWGTRFPREHIPEGTFRRKKDATEKAQGLRKSLGFREDGKDGGPVHIVTEELL